MIRTSVVNRPLLFKTPGGTSRGVLTDKPTWLIVLSDELGNKGYGECSLIPKLSIDNLDQLKAELLKLSSHTFESTDEIDTYYRSLNSVPALRFAIETALIDLIHGGNRILFDTNFVRGKEAININGLIWMGSKENMLQQVTSKIDAGFTCIKLKIGAINFEEELAVLAFIRKQFSSDAIEIRVDANGAFSAKEALEKLKQLSDYSLHSIEQPIKQQQWEEMAYLCETSPLNIALDEELIGISDIHQKRECLEIIKPQYIILKPSLLGGLNAAKEWIDIAESMQIGWWNTSALESNIGLNAIAQWTHSLRPSLPQGLGTGQLFTNNIESPLTIINGHLHYDTNLAWELP